MATSPEALWRLDPSKRTIDFWGVFTGTLLAGGEDELIAVAGGAATSFKNRDLEDRATIRGGIDALRAAGVAGYPDTAKLLSQLIQGPDADQTLIRAAGSGSTLRAASDHIRRAVITRKVERIAWGARGLYILENLEGFTVVRGVASATLAAIPLGVTQLVALAVQAHGAISAAAAQEMGLKFQGYIESGVAALAQQAGTTAPASGTTAPASGGAKGRPPGAKGPVPGRAPVPGRGKAAATAAPAATAAFSLASIPTWAWIGAMGLVAYVVLAPTDE